MSESERHDETNAAIVHRCSVDDMAAVHWISRGTHEGEFVDIEPTGAQIEFEGMEFVRFEDGKIVESHVVWDALGVLGQLGAIEPPGE